MSRRTLVITVANVIVWGLIVAVAWVFLNPTLVPWSGF